MKDNHPLPLENHFIARIISRVFSPPLVSIFCVIAAAAYLNTAVAWGWAVFQTLFPTLIPVAYVFWLLKTQRITDFDIFIREQRTSTYLITSICAGLAVIIMMLANADRLQIAMSMVALLLSILLWSINRHWKISAHASATAGFTVLQLYLLGMSGLLFLSMIPLVAWSRVKLGRHTTYQTIAGSLLGVSTSLFTLLVFAGN